MAVKICLANAKGGVGKTTTSICLAQELQRRGYRVLLIDTDEQCNSTAFYDAKTENNETVVDILCGDLPAIQCIQHTAKGDIIASDKMLQDAENMVRIDERRFTHLKRSIRSVEDMYDYIICDTPPKIGVETKNVLAMSDYIIIPVEESGWSLDGIMDFAKAIELAQDNNENLSVAGLLIIKAKENTRISKRINELTESLAQKLSTIRFNTKIRDSVACREALTEFYVPLYEYSPKGTTNQDYIAFTNELLEVIR